LPRICRRAERGRLTPWRRYARTRRMGDGRWAVVAGRRAMSVGGWAMGSILPDFFPRPDGNEVLARVDVLVLLGAVLLLVQLPIAATERDQLQMRAALDDLAVFQHEDLVRALDRRQTMGDDERRSAAAQRAKTVADQRFAL